MTGAMELPEFERQLGPFVLVHKPPDEDRERMSLELGADPTKPTTGIGDKLNIMLSFDNLVVATLPPLKKTDVLTVGRLADSELVIDDPSISKNHARILWNGGVATLEDLGASNGTQVNGARVSAPVVLKDQDEIHFGKVPYTFVAIRTFYVRLSYVRETTDNRIKRYGVPPPPRE